MIGDNLVTMGIIYFYTTGSFDRYQKLETLNSNTLPQEHIMLI